MIDYSICYRHQYKDPSALSSLDSYDLFIAAITEDDRVRAAYDNVASSQKIWLLLPELEIAVLPNELIFAEPDAATEADYFASFPFFRQLTARSKIAVDISGILAPYLLFLIRRLALLGVQRIDCIYVEPDKYIEREETRFSGEDVLEVRQISGYQGTHDTDSSKDLLVIGSGYDHQLVKSVAEAKEGAKAIQMFGLPALRPDMYQQNIIRTMRASESIGRAAGEDPNNFLVSAHDPFRVASFLSELRESREYTNLYLSPLATKPQILGFGLFYIIECLNEPISILYPICKSFPAKTCTGTGRIWVYQAEFDL